MSGAAASACDLGLGSSPRWVEALHKPSSSLVSTTGFANCIFVVRRTQASPFFLTVRGRPCRDA